VHALAAGGWVGGLLLLLAATAFKPAAAQMLGVVRRFNGVALGCSALVVATGVIASWMIVGSIDSLLRSPYGAQLIAKIVLVAMTAALGAHNWKRGTPALARGDDRLLKRGLFLEVAFSLAIVIATARLVILSPPE
jgi:putative copper export protein